MWSASAAVVSRVSPLLAALPPDSSSTPFSYDVSSVAISIFPTSTVPPVVLTFPYISVVLSPLSLSPSAALSSAYSPVLQYSPPAHPLYPPVEGYSISLCLLPPFLALFTVPTALLVVDTAPPAFATPLPSALPPAPLSPPPLSRGLLHPPVPPYISPPPALAPAADIARKGKDVGDHTGGYKMLW